jgi:hypothetical protein
MTHLQGYVRNGRSVDNSLLDFLRFHLIEQLPKHIIGTRLA